MATLYSTAKTKIEKDLDLESEDFVQDEEMLGYFNEAIREAEAEVIGIDPDYFLTSTYLPLEFGESLYGLPNGIYAKKIRSIIYNNGSLVYEIKQIRGVKKFLERADLIIANPTNIYQYMVLNDSDEGFQIELSPPSKETSASNVRIWFVRKVAELTGVGEEYIDKDIPECTNFVYSYVKGKCKQKEAGGEMPADARAEIDKQRQIFVDSLSTPIPDDDNEVLKDTSIYEESS